MMLLFYIVNAVAIVSRC